MAPSAGFCKGREVKGVMPFMLLAIIASMPGYAADVFNGRELYERHCITCHGSNGQGELVVAPDFTRPNALLNTDLDLYQIIRSGRGVMPAYRGILDEHEFLDLVAYLRTLN